MPYLNKVYYRPLTREEKRLFEQRRWCVVEQNPASQRKRADRPRGAVRECFAGSLHEECFASKQKGVRNAWRRYRQGRSTLAKAASDIQRVKEDNEHAIEAGEYDENGKFRLTDEFYDAVSGVLR